MTEISPNKLLDSLFDGLYCVDTKRRIVYWNKAAERITGYPAAEVIGSCCSDNILEHIDNCGRELCKEDCPLAATMRDGKPREVTVMAHHKSGYRIPVQIRTSPVTDDEGNVVGVVEIFNDNANEVQILQELERLKHEAFMDQLTEVGNRRYCEMALDSMIFEWRVHAIPFGLLFLDVDRFKVVNDRWGHKTGDDVLVMVAKSIRNVVRGLDIVARWGGEEFVVILPQANIASLASMAERIRTTVEQSFIMQGKDRIGVTVSVGGAVVSDGESAESIVAKADAEMYRCKKNGRNRVSMWEGPKAAGEGLKRARVA